MAKIKDIIDVLETYEKIVHLVGGEELDGIKEFRALLKNYRQLEISAFEQKLGQGQKKKDSTASLKNHAIWLGGLYFKEFNQKGIDSSQREPLNVYLSLPENKRLKSVLDLPNNERCSYLSQLPDKELTTNQLAFLGMALLNIRLKGRTKADQKKNLLGMLWSVNENQAMNEIYTGAI